MESKVRVLMFVAVTISSMDPDNILQNERR